MLSKIIKVACKIEKINNYHVFRKSSINYFGNKKQIDSTNIDLEASNSVKIEQDQIVKEKNDQQKSTSNSSINQTTNKLKVKGEKLISDEKQVDPIFFSQLDIRIGKIIQCWKHPESQNLYCEKIDTQGGVREIATGLQKHVTIDEMRGLVLVLANLKPRPMVGFLSSGMLLCCVNANRSEIKLVSPEGEVGERVFLEGFQELFPSGDLLPILNPKKKILQKCLQDFKTDEEGRVVWKGIKLRSKAGYIQSSIKHALIS